MDDKKRPCTPEESLQQSLQDMKQMREGKKKKTTWEQYMEGD
ncbi:MAG: hypothetical protein ACOCP4_03195 [Candidatus Woesearchaeota archaeon]